jgi:hypothetical protein
MINAHRTKVLLIKTTKDDNFILLLVYSPSQRQDNEF